MWSGPHAIPKIGAFLFSPQRHVELVPQSPTEWMIPRHLEQRIAQIHAQGLCGFRVSVVCVYAFVCVCDTFRVGGWVVELLLILCVDVFACPFVSVWASFNSHSYMSSSQCENDDGCQRAHVCCCLRVCVLRNAASRRFWLPSGRTRGSSTAPKSCIWGSRGGRLRSWRCLNKTRGWPARSPALDYWQEGESETPPKVVSF